MGPALSQIMRYYNLIIFTASDQSYADSIINRIDPTKEYFKYRLYRQNCVKLTTENGTVYVKDLRIIRNVPLQNMVIIDNSVLSFAFQLDNGIPILPFYNNKDDAEMESLKNYLTKLAKCENLVASNGANFNLKVLLEEAQNTPKFIGNEETSQNQSQDDTKADKTIESKTIKGPQRKASKIQTLFYETMENMKKGN